MTVLLGDMQAGAGRNNDSPFEPSDLYIPSQADRVDKPRVLNS